MAKVSKATSTLDSVQLQNSKLYNTSNQLLVIMRTLNNAAASHNFSGNPLSLIGWLEGGRDERSDAAFIRYFGGHKMQTSIIFWL